MRISDWSSDVCSSDLPEIFVFLVGGAAIGLIFGTIPGLQNVTALAILLPFTYALAPAQAFAMMVAIYAAGAIGRASCRERVCQYVYIQVVDVSFTTTQTSKFIYNSILIT